MVTGGLNYQLIDLYNANFSQKFAVCTPSHVSKILALKEGWRGATDENGQSSLWHALPKEHAGPRSEKFECVLLLGLQVDT